VKKKSAHGPKPAVDVKRKAGPGLGQHKKTVWGGGVLFVYKCSPDGSRPKLQSVGKKGKKDVQEVVISLVPPGKIDRDPKTVPGLT